MVLRLRAALLSLFLSFNLNALAETSSTAANEWEWHAVSGSSCRNGSEAGFFLRRNVFDQRLLIYLEGGGACFNSLTCSATPQAVGNQYPGREGIFAKRDDNPVQGWNTVYVPYCTGDVHTGNRSGVSVGGVNGKQNFVGAQNLQLYIDEVQKQMPSVELVVLSGSSAGGIGASFNYPHVRNRWPDTPVLLLDDSGFPVEDNVLRPCLQKTFRELWGLNDLIPEDCLACKAKDGGGLVEFVRYLRETYADTQLGLILSTQDNILRFFYGFSQNDCRVLVPGIAGRTFEKAVQSLKENYLQDNLKTYIIPGDTHTFLSSNRFYQTKSEGQSIASWVIDLIEQKAVDRGPF